MVYPSLPSTACLSKADAERINHAEELKFVVCVLKPPEKGMVSLKWQLWEIDPQGFYSQQRRK